MTKICFVYRTESLRQTDLLFVALSHCNKQNWYMLPKRCQKGPTTLNFLLLFALFWHLLCLLGTFCAFFLYIFCIFDRFCIFFAINSIFVCRSDSVQQTKNLFVAVTQYNKQGRGFAKFGSEGGWTNQRP